MVEWPQRDYMQSIGVFCGRITVLLGPVRVKKYDKCEAEKREEVSEKLLEELMQRCNTLITFFSLGCR